ncbi:putative tRNA pseudouridine synthase A [Cocos nucifera]|uniref:Putative tRNA pseudouridine synthase A n=1 Tax=Cocos nucifera TaxID=13894 RepID=A0A8K0IGT7_COCNU|nr:putative tRNA pseudouridine synthase A [Cocos nucifera]
MGRELRTLNDDERNDLGSGVVGGEDDGACNLNSEIRISIGLDGEGSKEANNGEFESDEVESALGINAVDEGHGSASNLNVEGENEAKNGEIESRADDGSAANLILDSAVDSGAAKVEEM